MTMEGGRPLEGKPNFETLVGLRTFYNLGLRALQLVDNGRNRIGDGKGESRTKGGLTNFGISVIKEIGQEVKVIDLKKSDKYAIKMDRANFAHTIRG